MKISLDYRIFLLQRYGGVSRYFLGLGKELKNIGQDVQIHAPLNINPNLQESSLLNKPSIFLPRYSTKFKADRIATYVSSRSTERFLLRFKPEILHQTYYGIDYKVNSKITRFITVYDFVRERTSPDYSKSAEKRKSILAADFVICISESTKMDLMNHVNIDESRVKVVPLSADLFFYEGEVREVALNAPFFLYVGQRSGYKNFSLLLKTFSRLPRSCDGYNLHVFGGGPLNSDELRMISNLGLNDRVIKVDGDDVVLKSQYHHAHAFIYPSLYEGFGIPILEAMAVGCPVITSNTSSMPEVAGGAALLFDPFEADSLEAALAEIVLRPQLRDDLIHLGRLRATQFSWSNTANQTLNFYKEARNVN
jgi:glycosyltransferase involved in cell wall biosynthesis